MVQNAEWGPHLWRILHICAEKCGKQPTPLLHLDEIRAWIHLLKLTEAILPCPLCLKHYREWLKAQPLPAFLEMRSGTAFQEAAREWVWKLHNRVNEQRSVGVMPIEEVIELYREGGARDLNQSLQKLMEVLDRAKLQRQIDGAFLRDWSQRLSTLRKFIRV
jgi:hypothetical protein